MMSEIVIAGAEEGGVRALAQGNAGTHNRLPSARSPIGRAERASHRHKRRGLLRQLTNFRWNESAPREPPLAADRLTRLCSSAALAPDARHLARE